MDENQSKKLQKSNTEKHSFQIEGTTATQSNKYEAKKKKSKHKKHEKRHHKYDAHKYEEKRKREKSFHADYNHKYTQLNSIYAKNKHHHHHSHHNHHHQHHRNRHHRHKLKKDKHSRTQIKLPKVKKIKPSHIHTEKKKSMIAMSNLQHAHSTTTLSGSFKNFGSQNDVLPKIYNNSQRLKKTKYLARKLPPVSMNN